MLEIIICILLGICILTIIICTAIVCTKRHNQNEGLSEVDKQAIINSFNGSIGVISQTLSDSQKLSNENSIASLKSFQENMAHNYQMLETRLMELTKQLDERMQKMSNSQEEKLEAIRQSNERNIKSLQEDNNKQLDRMRETVDEKLAKTINERFDESFKVLSGQLESVYKSLGEMQNIATDVGSLTKMLSNVKTTGIFGEIQLGAILEQLLTPDQYDTNIITGEGREPVEFALKMPGVNEGEYVYLPIDSKFPYTIYNDLQTAYENNNFELVKQKKEQLKNTIKNMAKDINNKYICPPRTTNFAVMFLPIEGLYAEVAKQGLIEELQNKYNVTVAGPTTMSALLNSYQMGFRTLAIQKKSGEVWKILGAVRTEFEKFNVIIDRIRSKLEGTSKEFDALIGTRSRMIASKLKSVEKLDSDQSTQLLGLDDYNQTDVDQAE